MVGRLKSQLRPRHGPPGRHLHWHLVRRRRRLLRAGAVPALFAVVGPGVLAGLSDDDPAGITTYSILGAKFGYRLLWVLAVSTLALIVFHELGARMGVVTKKGLLALVRDRYGPRGAIVALTALVVANLGTLCAEFAGVAAGLDLLAGVGRYISVPLAAIGVSLLVLRGSFHRVEHVLLALSSVFVAYIVSGFLAHPDWGATARGLVVPGMPLTRDAVLVAVATLGTTLAPWGLAFIQSYAVDKRLTVEDLRYERVDVIVGAVLTGVIGLFIVVACAATLHVNAITINDASDAAGALEPLAGHLAATLFGLGFLGAALLAACIVPLSTGPGYGKRSRRVARGTPSSSPSPTGSPARYPTPVTSSTTSPAARSSSTSAAPCTIPPTRWAGCCSTCWAMVAEFEADLIRARTREA
jgi:Mn2+/Fe2+ NRAMP family transporter